MTSPINLRKNVSLLRLIKHKRQWFISSLRNHLLSFSNLKLAIANNPIKLCKTFLNLFFYYLYFNGLKQCNILYYTLVDNRLAKDEEVQNNRKLFLRRRLQLQSQVFRSLNQSCQSLGCLFFVNTELLLVKYLQVKTKRINWSLVAKTKIL